jgi:TolA-binding protein
LAEQSLKKGIGMDDSLSDAHFFLSQIYYDQGRFEEAQEAEAEYFQLIGGSVKNIGRKGG